MMFDRDELGDDPEQDSEMEIICEVCGELMEDCECEDDDIEEE